MIAQFLSKIRLEDIDGGHMMLIQPLKFYSAKLKGIVIAPAGFVTDFASIPRIATVVLPKNGLYDGPSILHDAAYRDALVNIRQERIHLIKPLADSLFLEAMQAAGVGAFSRTVMFNAVRFFGGTAYEADQQAAHAAREGDHV